MAEVKFLGMTLATPLTIERVQTRSVSRSWNGHADETTRPDTLTHVLATIAPDSMPEGVRHDTRNYAGKLLSHLRKHGAAQPFDEIIPQLPDSSPFPYEERASDFTPRTVRAQAAAGATQVLITGTVIWKPGRIVTFGSSKRQYMVTDIVNVGPPTPSVTLHLDIPLEVPLTRGTTVNAGIVTGSWVWGEDSVANPPGFTRGFLFAEGWLLEAWEYLD